MITSGEIYPIFFNYMKNTLEELTVIPFSIIFTYSKKNFIEKHKNDEIGTLYNKTFFNRGGVVDQFNGVTSFIDEIYSNLNNFESENKYKGQLTKDYSGLIVFEEVKDYLPLPSFYEDIYNNKHIDFAKLNDFTKFFLKNFCTENIEKLLKPLILFKEVPEVIISKYWARIYTHESPFYSIMNKNLMNNNYKEYEIYIKLLYRGLSCNSYRPKYRSTLSRGTKLELSEINYLKSISGKNITIFNKSFLSFSPIKLSIEFQDNEERSIENENCIIEENKENILEFNKKEKKNSLTVLINIINIEEKDQINYVISNAYLKNISYYSNEEEVLIFPYTGFEVAGWGTFSFVKDNVEEEGTVFYFKFSKNYLQMINEKYGH